MKIKNFEFRPGFKGFVLTLIAVAVFGYLAVWQLGRAHERDLLRQQVIERSQMPVQPLDIKTVSLSENRYQRFQMLGQFLNQGQVILDNVVNNGKAGYEVITPFKLTGSDHMLLVNRGWLAADANRAVLPDITVDESLRMIEASLDKPRSAPVVSANVVESAYRWNYLDTGFYRTQMQMDVPDYLLLLSPDSGAGYLRHKPAIEDKSGMHIGYAIQWAAFALIALGTYIGLGFRRIQTTAENEEENRNERFS